MEQCATDAFQYFYIAKKECHIAKKEFLVVMKKYKDAKARYKSAKRMALDQCKNDEQTAKLTNSSNMIM